MAKPSTCSGVLRQIEDARPQNAVIVLDACRDNPVAGRSKNASKGLSRVQSQPGNTYVVFAAQAGTTASDNGVFAKALAQHITEPNVGMRVVFDNVSKAVKKASGNKQSIQRDDRLDQDIVLLASVGVVPVGGDTPAPNFQTRPSMPAPQTATSTDPETALWNEVKASGSMEYLDIYLKKYPKGKYTELARLEQKKLLDAQRQQKETADRASGTKPRPHTHHRHTQLICRPCQTACLQTWPVWPWHSSNSRPPRWYASSKSRLNARQKSGLGRRKAGQAMCLRTAQTAQRS
jgi:hypothetical protein